MQTPSLVTATPALGQEWAVQRTLAEVQALFPPATRVRPLNPKLVGWEGVVTAAPEHHELGGKHIHNTAHADGINVRVVWTSGHPGGPLPANGWFGAHLLAPVG